MRALTDTRTGVATGLAVDGMAARKASHSYKGSNSHHVNLQSSRGAVPDCQEAATSYKLWTQMDSSSLSKSC